MGGSGSSVYRHGKQKEAIHFQDVVAFFAEHGIGRVDLLKVNIEGGEYEVMPRLIESGLITRIHSIQIQYHKLGPHSERWMDAINEALSQTHLRTYRYRFVWENWRRIDTADLLIGPDAPETGVAPSESCNT